MLIARLADTGEVVVAIDKWWVPVDLVDAGTRTVEDALRDRDDLAASCVGFDVRRAPADRLVPRDQARLSCPLPPPRKVFAVGLNYRGHVAEIKASFPTEPFVFLKSSNALADPCGSVTLAADQARHLDYEVELAIVVGERCRNVPRDRARAAVGGLAIANDLSAREWQNGSPWTQWLRAKGLDGCCPIGPWITTLHDIDDVRELGIRCYVNEELRQNDVLGSLIFDMEAMISWISQGVTLEVGDVILTGTPAGVLFGSPNPAWLKSGDIVRCEIDRLGAIEHELVLVEAVQ